jgi:glycosyltransferase involved in cell wall biosynthesis
MNTLPLITVGIPAYGRPIFLRDAIKSCLAQEYPHLEILVADDASPQDPWPEIADLANEKWRYVRHEKNKGGPANFNYLIEQARGKFFILHQDDDCLHPQFCRLAAEALGTRPEAVFTPD